MYSLESLLDILDMELMGLSRHDEPPHCWTPLPRKQPMTNVYEHVGNILEKTWGLKLEHRPDMDAWIAVDKDGDQVCSAFLSSYILEQSISLAVSCDAAGMFIASVIQQLCINEAGKQTVDGFTYKPVNNPRPRSCGDVYEKMVEDVNTDIANNEVSKQERRHHRAE